MKHVFTLILVTTMISGNAQPIFGWARTIGSTANESARTTAKDAAGNVYACGTFQSTIDFDPGPAEALLTSAGSLDNYIMKLDPSGNFLWAKRIGGPSIEVIMSILVDASGNLVISGYYDGTVDFDPGPGVFELPPIGGNDIFILKLNNDGEFLWAKSIGGTGADDTYSMAIDQDGNLLLSGAFSGTVDFDPGPGIANLVSSLQSAYILKLNASGEYIWAKTINSPNGSTASSIALSTDGNIYISGHFMGEADFDPGPGENKITANGVDGYVLKMTTSGNLIWVRVLNITGNNIAFTAAVNAAGEVYIGGYFSAQGDFDPGPGTFMMTPGGGYDGYICKFDAAGDFIWARKVGGPGGETVEKIALDNQGNLYAAGNFNSVIDLDPGTGTAEFTSNGDFDIFVLKLDPSGSFIWGQQIGGPNQQQLIDLKVTAPDHLYLAGVQVGSMDFDPGPGTQIHPGVGLQDGYFLYLKGSPTLPLLLLHFNAINNKNDVDLQWKTEREIQVSNFDLERSADGKHFTSIGKIAANNQTQVNQYAFSDATPPAGTLFYRLKITDIDGAYTYSRIVAVKRNNAPSQLLVFPNPAKDILFVQAPDSETAALEITDLTGRIILQQSVSLQRNAAFAVNVQLLLPGKYFLVLKSKRWKKAAGFIKN